MALQSLFFPGGWGIAGQTAFLQHAAQPKLPATEGRGEQHFECLLCSPVADYAEERESSTSPHQQNWRFFCPWQVLPPGRSRCIFSSVFIITISTPYFTDMLPRWNKIFISSHKSYNISISNVLVLSIFGGSLACMWGLYFSLPTNWQELI